MLRDFKIKGSVIIADNAAISDEIHIPSGHTIAGIDIPAGWVAADVGFHIATDGTSTYVPVIDPARAAATSYARAANAAASSFVLAPECIRDIAIGLDVKLTSINAASNADVSQTGGPLTLVVWIGKVF